eukprot:IDg2333t1
MGSGLDECADKEELAVQSVKLHPCKIQSCSTVNWDINVSALRSNERNKPVVNVLLTADIYVKCCSMCEAFEYYFNSLGVTTIALKEDSSSIFFVDLSETR